MDPTRTLQRITGGFICLFISFSVICVGQFVIYSSRSCRLSSLLFPFLQIYLQLFHESVYMYSIFYDWVLVLLCFMSIFIIWMLCMIYCNFGATTLINCLCRVIYHWFLVLLPLNMRTNPVFLVFHSDKIITIAITL